MGSPRKCFDLALEWEGIMKGQNQQMMPIDVFMVANAILAGILVGICSYRPRYRHRAFIRFLFQGATTLFLPIVSYVVSNDTYISRTIERLKEIAVHNLGENSDKLLGCTVRLHSMLVLFWAGLVQIVGINTCAIVATDDREGRNTGLPVVLLVQAIWTSYLAVYSVDRLLLGVFALIFAKLVFKYYAFHKARRSFALGRNPRLIVGYMEQLQGEIQHVGPTVEHLPPPLIVMGEERQQVAKQPHGYCFKRMPNQDDMTMINNDNGLVTINKVWQLDDKILTSIPRLRDVCFSFALFKLLRCRFAGYTLAEAGFMKARNFFWHVLLMDGDHERVLGVITDELSFLHDYYYSSLPISYSKRWLPIFSIFSSLITTSYCLFITVVMIILPILDPEENQIYCLLLCDDHSSDRYANLHDSSFGKLYYDLVPVYLLLVLVVLAEARDIASNICSNWTKVALVCRYMVNHDTWQRSPSMQKWVGRVLRCRCKLMKHWDDKMNQCSVLVLHPRKTLVVLLMHLLHLPDQNKDVKVQTVVKTAIVDALRSSDGQLSNGATSLRRNLQGSENFLWACSGKGTAEIILIWHIATTILEVRHPKPQPPASDYKIIATHLSRYCAYLVAYVPELLPDDDKWCKSLYKDVKKDSMRVLDQGRSSMWSFLDFCSSSTTVQAGEHAEVEEYEKLVALLSERSKHEVLNKGVKLGKQLVELTEDEEVELTEGEEAAWRVLAGFWSEMIMFVAPSDNLSGHMAAIARGGELITLVWALLMHAGISTRPNAAAATSV